MIFGFFGICGIYRMSWHHDVGSLGGLPKMYAIGSISRQVEMGKWVSEVLSPLRLPIPACGNPMMFTAGPAAPPCIRCSVYFKCRKCHDLTYRSSQEATLGIFGGTSEHSPKTLENEAAGASQHRPASIGTSTPVGTRTRNHSLRRRVLYPVELQARRS